jgi:hypothetical protein
MRQRQRPTGLRTNPDATIQFDAPEPREPTERRYVTNDTSYEKLGEILAENPNGILAHRDELVSLLKTLDREEFAAARGFFLTAWNGKGPLHLRPHHAGQDAYRGGLRKPSRVHTARTSR